MNFLEQYFPLGQSAADAGLCRKWPERAAALGAPPSGWRKDYPRSLGGWFDMAADGLERRFKLHHIFNFSTVDATPTVVFTSPDLITGLTLAAAFRCQLDVWGVEATPTDTVYAYLRRHYLFTGAGPGLTHRCVNNDFTCRNPGTLDAVLQVDGTLMRLELQVTGDALIPMNWSAELSIIRQDGQLIL